MIGLQSCIIDFPVIDTAFLYRRRPTFPTLISSYDKLLSRFPFQPQFCQKLKVLAIKSVHILFIAESSLIPSISKGCPYGIFLSFFQKRCYIISHILYPVVIIRIERRQIFF